MTKNWFMVEPLQKCEIHDKPYLYTCYKCMRFCASELDCRYCRGLFKSWLPFPDELREEIVRYIAPKLTFFHGNCKRQEEFLEQFGIETNT